MMPEPRWMHLCLELADRGRGRTAPNPMVGAIIVRGEEVLAEGWHRAPGQAHAEVDALAQLGVDAAGATMFVNLEPCCHHGRTPPCTDAIIASGIRRVVVGIIDPDSRMQGKGIAQLQDAGVSVEVGVAEADCRTLNEAYFSVLERGRPWVTVKAAITLDGRIADADGESQWITGPEAREAGHALRDGHDAVMVGAGTLRADDPALNTRLSGGRDALPVLLDTTLGCPDDAKILHAGRRPVIFCAEGLQPRRLAADVVPVCRSDSGLDLVSVLEHLTGRGVHSVLVEGGGKVIRSLLDQDLVDRIELFIAPKVLAGGPGWVGGVPFPLSAAPGFEVVLTETVGSDAHLTLERA
jgi:diaminohydroxyphosphoribosylaminopyrimidine deaminase/5-amino-6-(5-phosphoribosylamino)uracil reductase